MIVDELTFFLNEFVRLFLVFHSQIFLIGELVTLFRCKNFIIFIQLVWNWNRYEIVEIEGFLLTGFSNLLIFYVLRGFSFFFLNCRKFKFKKNRGCKKILNFYSPFCVPAKVTKLIGLKRPPFLSPTNLIIFACTQNGELNTFIETN